MHLDLTRMLFRGADAVGLGVWEPGAEYPRALGLPAEGAVDDRFAAAELGEGVGADAELADAPARSAAGVGGAVPGGLVGPSRRSRSSRYPSSRRASSARISGRLGVDRRTGRKLSASDARSPGCSASSGSAAEQY